MKICTACGLPAPLTTSACALCSHSFPDQGPACYRFERHHGGYRWLLDGEETVKATCRDGLWEVVGAGGGGGKVAVTLIGVFREERTRVAMVDHRHRTVAMFVPTEADASSGRGLVGDTYDQVVMALRADGPTGMHVVDRHGRVLALISSRPRGGRDGLDLLITRAGGSGHESVLFAVSLALEVLRAGELVSRALTTSRQTGRRRGSAPPSPPSAEPE